MNTEKYQAIAQGWKNYIFKSDTVEELAKTRAKICSECPHIDTEYPFKNMLPDKSIKIIEGTACSLCGCPLSAKLRQVLQSCPDTPKRWQ